MSVINKMLRDLDNRGGLGPRKLEEGMKEVQRVPLDDDTPKPWGKISAAVIVIALVAAGGWYLTQPSAPPQVAQKPAAPAVPKPAPAAPAPAPVQAASTPVPPSTGEPPKPLPQAPVVAAAPEPATPAKAPPVAAAAKAPVPAPAPAPAPAKQAAAAIAPSGVLALPDAAKSSVAAQQASVSASEKAVESAAASIPAKPAPTKAPPPVPKPEVVAKIEPVPAKAPPPKSEKTEPAPPADDSPARINVDRGQRAITGPARATTEYRRGNDLLAQGRVDGAIAAYQDALRADPRHVPSRQAMVVVFLERGRGDEAVAALRDGIEAVPTNTAWPMLLARLQVDAQDVKGATTTLQRSLQAGGADSEYQAFLATLLQMQSRHVEAIQHYQASLQLDPGSGRSLTGLGISLEAEKRLPEARDAYRRALATNGLGRELEAFAQARLKQIQ